MAQKAKSVRDHLERHSQKAYKAPAKKSKRKSDKKFADWMAKSWTHVSDLKALDLPLILKLNSGEGAQPAAP